MESPRELNEWIFSFKETSNISGSLKSKIFGNGMNDRHCRQYELHLLFCWFDLGVHGSGTSAQIIGKNSLYIFIKLFIYFFIIIIIIIQR